MGDYGTSLLSPRTVGTAPLPPKTTFETIAEPITELLDAPANVARAISIGEFGEAAKTLLPFVPARKIEGTEVAQAYGLGEGFAAGLGAELALDPLNFVGGILNPTKYGKLVARASHLRNEVNALKRMGKVEDAVKSKALLEATIKEARAEKLISSGKTSYILRADIPFTGKGIDIGDRNKLVALVSKLNPLPDAKINILNKELQGLDRAVKTTENLPDTRTKYYHGMRSELSPDKNRDIFISPDIEFANDFTKPTGSEYKQSPLVPFRPEASMVSFKLKPGTKIFDSTDKSKMYEVLKKYSSQQGELGLTARNEIIDLYLNYIHRSDTTIPTFDNVLQHVTDLFSDNYGVTWDKFSKDFINFIRKQDYAGVTELEFGIKNLHIFGTRHLIPMATKEFYKTPEQLKKLEELTTKRDATAKLISESHKGIIPLHTANKMRDALKSLSAKFSHTVKSDLLETASDITKTSIAKSMEVLPKQAASMLADIDTIAKTRGVSVIEQAARLGFLGERRHLIDADANAIDDTVAHFVQNKTDKYLAERASREAKIKASTLTDTEKQIKLDKLQEKFISKVEKLKLNAEARHIELSKFIGDIKAGEYLPSEIDAVNKFYALQGDMPAIERAAGIHSPELGTNILSYIRRLITPEAKTLRSTDKELHNLIMSEFNIQLPSAKQRRLYPELTIRDINAKIKEQYKIKFDFFNENVVSGLIDRRVQHIQSVERARYLNFAVETYARSGLTKSNGMLVPSFLKKMGLNPRHKRYETLKSLRIPRESVDMITRTESILKNSLFNNTPNLNKLMQFVASVNQPFKALLTTPFPGYHHRNFISNTVLNMIGGVPLVKQLPLYIKSFNLRHKIAKGIKLSVDEERLWKELVGNRIVNTGLMHDVQGLIHEAKGPLGQGFEEFINRPLSAIKQLVTKGEITKSANQYKMNLFTGRAYGGFIEDMGRMVHYLAKREAGLSEIEAMRSVNKYLFDYTKLTTFEQQIARPTMLFYTWMRNNIPLMLSTSLHNPRAIKLYEDITGINSEDVPQYLRSARSFRIGQKEAIGSLGLPMEDLNIFSVADADPDTFSQLSKAADNFITRLSPVFKVPIELIKGKETFGGQSLSDIGLTEYVKRNLPTSRITRTGEKLIDPENPLPFKMLDLMTGIRTYPINQEQTYRDQLKRRALLSGKFQRSGFLVFPKKEYKVDKDVKKQYKKLTQEIAKSIKREHKK
mgnify:FL=1